MRGAQDAGHQVDKIRIATKNIGYCRACYFCRDHKGQCAIKDDMAEILEKLLNADVIVLATPVYFYSVNAQLKTVIDRIVARWLEIQGKEFYYIMSAAEDTTTVMDTTLACLRGLANCLEGSIERGVIYGKGVYEKGEIKNNPIMLQAYKMGQDV